MSERQVHRTAIGEDHHVSFFIVVDPVVRQVIMSC